jgi:hypothetical protein
MTIEQLKNLLSSGQFDHATYREIGSIWEGLYIYAKEDSKIGFNLVGSFNVADGLADEAHELVRHTGVSVGSRGNG